MSSVVGIVVITCLQCATVGLSGEFAADDTIAGATDPTFHVQFQAGFGMRMSGRESGSEGPGHPFLLTWELSGYRWDKRSSTWGLGVRAAMDDLGFRAGPKAFARWPLGSAEGSYIQFGAAYYVFSGDGDLSDRPGWSGELEVSPLSGLAFYVGLEFLEYMVYEGSFGYYESDGAWQEETGRSWYAGAKVSNWTGVIVTAALFGLAGAAAAGSSGY